MVATSQPEVTTVASVATRPVQPFVVRPAVLDAGLGHTVHQSFRNQR